MDFEPKLSVTSLPDSGFFRVPALACRFIGVWPMDPGRLPFYAYINISLLTFSCVGGAWFTCINITQIQVFLDALCPTSTETLSLFKILTLAYYRKEFRALLIKLYELYKNGKSNSSRIYDSHQINNGHKRFRETTALYGHIPSRNIFRAHYIGHSDNFVAINRYHVHSTTNCDKWLSIFGWSAACTRVALQSRVSTSVHDEIFSYSFCPSHSKL